METNENIYKLSEEQKRELDAMENLSDEDFMTSEEFHRRIKLKYGI